MGDTGQDPGPRAPGSLASGEGVNWSRKSDSSLWVQPPQSAFVDLPALMFGVLGIAAGIGLAIVLTGVFVRSQTGLGLLQLLSIFRTGRTEMNVDQPTVVRQIQQLQRLETVSYTMDKIIGGGKDSPYLPQFLVGDRLLLLVHGEVIAGVDLQKLVRRYHRDGSQCNHPFTACRSLYHASR